MTTAKGATLFADRLRNPRQHLARSAFENAICRAVAKRGMNESNSAAAPHFSHFWSGSGDAITRRMASSNSQCPSLCRVSYIPRAGRRKPLEDKKGGGEKAYRGVPQIGHGLRLRCGTFHPVLVHLRPRLEDVLLGLGNYLELFLGFLCQFHRLHDFLGGAAPRAPAGERWSRPPLGPGGSGGQGPGPALAM